MKHVSYILLAWSLLMFAGCGDNVEKTYVYSPNVVGETDIVPVDITITATPVKWYNGHAAAVTVDHDGGWGQASTKQFTDRIVDDAAARNLVLDFELVTSAYEPYPSVIEELKARLLPLGMDVFGHGHTHVHHDDLSFEDAYTSFRTCYELMDAWGLEPVAYAYPHGSGRLQTTQLALKNAGFVSGRGYMTDEDYCCVGDEWTPDNMFLLPTMSVAYGVDGYVKSNAQVETILGSVLDDTAWAIITYHSVGMPEGWGYYPRDEFLADLDYISSHDFWCATLNAVTKYIYERDAVTTSFVKSAQTAEALYFSSLISDGWTMRSSTSRLRSIFLSIPSLKSQNSYLSTMHSLRSIPSQTTPSASQSYPTNA